MASTLATKKQSAAIRKKMQEIRNELPYDVDDARQRVRQLSDWKYHLRRRPLPILLAGAVAGYVLVPSKRTKPQVIVHRDGDASGQVPAKRSLLGGIAGAAATLLTKQAAALAANQVSAWLAKERPALPPFESKQTVP